MSGGLAASPAYTTYIHGGHSHSSLGIDVHAELRAKTGSPNLGPTHMPQNIVQPPPPIQRALINRHHQSRRSNSSIAPKSEPGATLPPPPAVTASPKSRPTPPSHSNSPTGTGSAFSPAPSDNMPMRGSVGGMTGQQMHPMSGRQQARPQPPPPASGGRQQQASSGASFYPTPAFQNHIEQLGKYESWILLSPYAVASRANPSVQSKNTMLKQTWWMTRNSIRQVGLVLTQPSPTRGLICFRHRPTGQDSTRHSKPRLHITAKQLDRATPR